MKYFRLFLPLFAMIILVACGSEFKPDTLSKKDIGIVKIDDSNASVYHGMKQAEAEKILGQGKGDLKSIIKYDYGVSVIYRELDGNATVAAIYLDKDAEKVYKTARGIKIGDTKSDVHKAYGEKYPIPTNQINRDISYVYDLTNKMFMGQVSIETEVKDKNELYDQIGVDFIFNDDGFVDRVMLYDRYAGMYFN
ncbi:hypothetical protein M5X00_16550 [Paenibacillus alvei]|uniref:Lipoprotein n=1 Tax=Paenibacillus alvei TaxID=44250 RepID=A0ABT4H786_PAEAL|nr:hypothetical protein [Paenibacillus alvei]EJW17569.1 hypothetical protein PAV_3c00140 [Paenibacillus alvei DSM 29]MCY9544536.1 hypothetical protein [Paenibacillus alvei]MCY9706945.1 hypothetical protein [Paenibacillus alvei]MCY9736085.1 hypothetical protein [Paenibacillus alvei]MCY9755851.1 hypothetical protein [Paenibacillus alvei]